MRYYGVQNEVKAYCNRLQSETSITVTPSLVKTLNDRVESLKKSGAWSQFGLGFNDNDGDSYLQRANVTDIMGRSEVLWFVRGMKSLGLWQNMVCWPLRDYQNAGTGSTVYSFGGLGVYNGTLINTISWDFFGLKTLNTISGRVDGTFRPISSSNFPITLFAVNIRNSNDYSSGIDSLIQVGTSTNNIFLARRGPVGNNRDDYTLRNNSGLNISTSVTLPPFNWYTIYSSINTSLANLSINKRVSNYVQNTSSQTLLLTNEFFSLSRNPSSGTGDSIQSFALIVLNSNVNEFLLHDLYKQTLGSNLSLP